MSKIQRIKLQGNVVTDENYNSDSQYGDKEIYADINIISIAKDRVKRVNDFCSLPLANIKYRRTTMRVLNFLSFVTIAATLLIYSPSYAKSLTAEEFIQKASMGNLFEIESSKLANERSEDENVKQFAGRMITDHTNVGSELEAAVSSSSLDKLLIAKTLDKKHGDRLIKLQKASAKDFDKKYIEAQKDAHEDAVELFEDYAEDGTDVELKAFAGRILPTLEDHEKQVKNLKSSSKSHKSKSAK